MKCEIAVKKTKKIVNHVSIAVTSPSMGTMSWDDPSVLNPTCHLYMGKRYSSCICLLDFSFISPNKKIAAYSYLFSSVFNQTLNTNPKYRARAPVAASARARTKP